MCWLDGDISVRFLNYRDLSIALLVGLLFSSEALRAQTPEPPLVEPRFSELNIRPGQSVTVTVRPGGCYNYSGVLPNPRITRTGTTVVALFVFGDSRNPGGQPCNVPVGDRFGEVIFPEAGVYTLRVDAEIINYIPILPVQQLASRQVVVAETAAVSVPINATWALLLTVLSLSIGAWFYAKR